MKMTRWRRSGVFPDLALGLALALRVGTLTLAVGLWLTTGAAGCPEPCQCTQSYYVYCQRVGLTSDNVMQLVTSVPHEALLLDLSSNSVDRLVPGLLDSLPHLEYLFLAQNEVHVLGVGVFRRQHKLRELSLSGNRLGEVGDGVFVNLSALTKLHLDDNHIQRIQPRAFALPQIQQLYLQRNRLSLLTPHLLSGLPSLQVLDLSDNGIQTVEVGSFGDLPALQVLRLSGNRLSSLAENVFQGLRSLKELHLDGNLLPALDCFDVPHLANTLHTLVLSNNSLISLPHDLFSQLRALRVLALDWNRISVVGREAFRDLQLDSLTLAHNQLDTLQRDMLEGSGRISRLDLSHNRLHTIKTGAFDSFRESVYVLNLSANRLGSVHRGMFRGMQNLQTLNLSSNSLTSILPGSFQDLLQLTDLDLDHNDLRHLSADLLQGPLASLRRLSVLGNPLQELTGFSFEGVQHGVEVWVNLTLRTATPYSLTLTWPYRQGAQLYWMSSIRCGSEKDSDPACGRPQSSLSPNQAEVTVGGLRAGKEYFVCVDPVFLSPRIKVSQCGAFSTLPQPPTTLRPQDQHDDPPSNGGPTTVRVNFGEGVGSWWMCLVVMLVAWRTGLGDLVTAVRDMVTLISWTWATPWLHVPGAAPVTDVVIAR